jgi:hypothetical protein
LRESLTLVKNFRTRASDVGFNRVESVCWQMKVRVVHKPRPTEQRVLFDGIIDEHETRVKRRSPVNKTLINLDI